MIAVTLLRRTLAIGRSIASEIREVVDVSENLDGHQSSLTRKRGAYRYWGCVASSNVASMGWTLACGGGGEGEACS